ncbi:MAG: IS110 family transposase [Bacteroidota bacterium]
MDLPILGIDIAKSKFDVCLLLNGKTKHKVCPNTPEGFQELLGWLSRQKVDRVRACMEATGTYGEALATFLSDNGHPVSVVNPARIKAFAQSEMVRTKTDKADSGVIARFCLAFEPESWSPPAPETRELRALVRRLNDLKEMAQMEENRLKSGLSSSHVVESIEKNLKSLKRQIREVEDLIRDHIDRHPGLKSQHDLLTSIPGVGEITANAFLGEVGDITRYQNARGLVAALGLSPRERRSGSSVRGKTRLCKTGNAILRRALYMPALVAKRINPLIKSTCDRLLERGKAKMAVIGAAMRKLVHIMFGVLKNQTPFCATAA